jgi:trehalose 2-sulfotransferase
MFVVDQEVFTPSRGYLLCCVERTGSNLLSYALKSTFLAGRPREYFNPFDQEMRAILGNATMITGFSKILVAATTPNGCFGTKLHWNHFRSLGEADRAAQGEFAPPQHAAGSGGPDPSDLLRVAAVHDSWRAMLPGYLAHAASAYALFRSRIGDLRVIWITRENMVARAISHFRAIQSDVWHRAPKSIDRLPRREYDFDAAEIHHLYCLGTFHQECWQRFFQEQGLEPLRIVYEDLVANYESTVRRVLAFLGLEGSVKSIAGPVSFRQADETSQKWELRYRQLLAEAGLE